VDGGFRMIERAFPMKASAASRLASLAPPDFNFRQRVSFDHFFFLHQHRKNKNQSSFFSTVPAKSLI
jgi:hypothetical protein